VDAGIKATTAELVEMVKAVRIDMGDAAADEFDALHRAVRHTLIGAMLDHNVTAQELRNELRSVVEMTLLATPAVGARQAVPGPV
jgi:hypothetical protein